MASPKTVSVIYDIITSKVCFISSIQYFDFQYLSLQWPVVIDTIYALSQPPRLQKLTIRQLLLPYHQQTLVYFTRTLENGRSITSGSQILNRNRVCLLTGSQMQNIFLPIAIQISSILVLRECPFANMPTIIVSTHSRTFSKPQRRKIQARRLNPAILATTKATFIRQDTNRLRRSKHISNAIANTLAVFQHKYHIGIQQKRRNAQNMPEPYSAEKNFSQEFAELLGQDKLLSKSTPLHTHPMPVRNRLGTVSA